jgi:cyclophilin family peptidyl-prolyl cis-trans isomerase
MPIKTRPAGPISSFVRYLTVFMLLLSGLSHADTPRTFQATLDDTKTYALLDTSMGQIELELYSSRTPKTVENFIHYAESGFYNDTLFHRVIPNFMVQGGGFDRNFVQKATQKPVRNEANAFIPNLRGTISMARTNDPDSATSQFFINVVDNASLNKNASNPGYAVFGKVIHGLNVADQISRVKTKREGYMSDIPVDPVIIRNILIRHPVAEASTEKPTP